MPSCCPTANHEWPPLNLPRGIRDARVPAGDRVRLDIGHEPKKYRVVRKSREMSSSRFISRTLGEVSYAKAVHHLQWNGGWCFNEAIPVFHRLRLDSGAHYEVRLAANFIDTLAILPSRFERYQRWYKLQALPGPGFPDVLIRWGFSSAAG